MSMWPALRFGAGILTDAPAACSIIGSTGMHMRAQRAGDVALNPERTGYVMCLPVPGMVALIQSNMAATLNIDWILDVAGDFLASSGVAQDRAADPPHRRLDGGVAARQPDLSPYISDAGDAGPCRRHRPRQPDRAEPRASTSPTWSAP